MRFAPTLVVAKMKGRATGDFHPTTRIGRTASIANLTGRNENLKIGKHSRIDGEIIVHAGGRLTIGDYCYVSRSTRIWVYSSITIDNYVIIAHNASIMDSTTHPIEFEHRRQQVIGQLTGQGYGTFDLRAKPIHLKEGVWICANAVVLRGVTLEPHTIVSAGSVVKRTGEQHGGASPEHVAGGADRQRDAGQRTAQDYEG